MYSGDQSKTTGLKTLDTVTLNKFNCYSLRLNRVLGNCLEPCCGNGAYLQTDYYTL